MRNAIVSGALGALVAAAALPLQALAQAYPEKPVKLIVTWPPGGSADAIGRLVAASLTTSLGQSVYVENAPGASGNIGTQQFVRSPADGYTLLLATSTTNAAGPALFTKQGFEAVDDFVPVAPIALSPSILIVAATSPYKSPQDIIAAAKAAPGKLVFGSGGNGNSGHLSAALFKSVARIDVQHVPYKGNSPATIDLIGGRLDFMFDNGAVPQILGGKVRGLAVTSAHRLHAVPEVPTFAELGLPGVQLSTWFGLAVPKGTPAPVVDKLNKAVAAALQKPDVVKRLNDMGAEPKTSSPAEFAVFWKQEIDRYRDLVKLSGATVE